ncbi:MAG: signal peptidase I [Chloroflexota bacterium]
MIRRIASQLLRGVLILFVAVWLVALRPQSLGGSALYVVVRGDSMLPTYQSGDLVVARSESSYAPGDIVAYRVPSDEFGAGRIVIHRISGTGTGNGFVVQGDHNPSPDPWSPRASDIAGRAWLVAPGLGRAVAFIHQPVVAGSLAAGLAVMVLLGRRPRTRVSAARSKGSHRRLEL